MAHEQLLAELDRRRATARAMGGPKRSWRRDASAASSMPRSAWHALVDPGSFVEVGLLGASARVRCRRRRRRRATASSPDSAASTDATSASWSTTSPPRARRPAPPTRARWATSAAPAPRRGMPFVHIGESTGARLPDAMGSKGMGSMLGNDITQFRRTRETPWAAAALDTLVRLLRLAMLLRRFRRDEEGLDHGGVEPAPGVDGDRREGRPRGARRLAPARRADRPDRLFRRHRRRGDGGDPPLPLLHAEPQRRAAAGGAGAGGLGRAARSASSRSCRRSARRSTT